MVVETPAALARPVKRPLHEITALAAACPLLVVVALPVPLEVVAVTEERRTRRKRTKIKAEFPDDDDDDDGPDPTVESDDEEDAEREIGVKALLKLIRGKSQKGKEADKITLGAMPNNAKFKAWRAALRQEVAACSSDPDKALIWIMKVESLTASSDNLLKSGLFRTLDAKLASALTKICSHGLIGQEINTKIEEAAQKGILLRGRQISLMIY